MRQHIPDSSWLGSRHDTGQPTIHVGEPISSLALGRQSGELQHVIGCLRREVWSREADRHRCHRANRTPPTRERYGSRANRKPYNAAAPSGTATAIVTFTLAQNASVGGAVVLPPVIVAAKTSVAPTLMVMLAGVSVIVTGSGRRPRLPRPRRRTP